MMKFAVIGNPISHSISPRLHNFAIKELNLNAFYGRILLEDINQLKKPFGYLNGANITVPFKEEAVQICDYLDVHSKKIGSVNTIIKNKDEFYGYNTDALGFLKSINEFKNIKSALIIGAGGTARAMAYTLNLNNIRVEIVNRSQKRAANFKDFEFFTWENFKPKSYDLIINSTSAGLIDDELPLPFDLLKETFEKAKFAYEVIYNKPTNFLNLAKSLDLITKNGKDMLIFQAALALNLFFSNKLDEEKIISYMKKAINLR
ncbi:shikimate dehydrogenase [Campylobacter sp. FMV-PI01]|uniref:Shikimate dehydrogenase (NADP(+)) n=1 Tax=Campylobacter portucalensis TaxID=2608384 RepID=A0A6L5WGZ2_9BACT|nr:shikimate dehydrogenase [Campylobacter portucalensis]MSN95632.1 shikimate dehydrogenase [Campylobacter portucalensis]